MEPSTALDRLIDFYQTITPESVTQFPEFYTADAYFKDPFNEVYGVGAIQHIFSHMFQQVESPRFTITDHVLAPNGAMLVWEFSFSVQRWNQGKTQVIHGASHLKFDESGKVIFHRDYWDAAEELYMKLPVVGWLMRRLAKLMAPSNPCTLCAGKAKVAHREL